MKLLQINSTVNSGSTGRIAEDIGKVLIANGHESYIAFGRGHRPSQSKLIRIGNAFDVYWHGLQTLLFDRHGFASKRATKRLINYINELKPDLVHLHNLHGYYLNIHILFEALEKIEYPVVWTFHDCWPFTGHCTYFEFESCFKWKSQCSNCPKKNFYPKSIFLDNSKRNFNAKKNLFTKIKHLTIVTPSNWLENYVKESFLQNFPVRVYHNGIDTSVFGVIENKYDEKYKRFGKYILGVANVWSSRKGMQDFYQLRQKIDNSLNIILVGLNRHQLRDLPNGVMGIHHTESVDELAALYRNAILYLNPTYQDNFPTTNIEALACGTPVITYNTGGSPEAVDQLTGRVVPKGDLDGIVHAIHEICSIDRDVWRKNCRARAEKHFDKNKQFLKYLQLYEEMIRNSSSKI